MAEQVQEWSPWDSSWEVSGLSSRKVDAAEASSWQSAPVPIPDIEMATHERRQEGRGEDTLSRALSLSSEQGFYNLLTKSISLQQACYSWIIP